LKAGEKRTLSEMKKEEGIRRAKKSSIRGGCEKKEQGVLQEVKVRFRHVVKKKRGRS